MSEPRRPKFSLIVSTIGRIEPLRDLFASLLSQSFRDFEVILIDQSCSETVRQAVQEIHDKVDIRYEPMTEKGLSRGRNRGLVFARGEIIGFPDDDCVIPPDYLGEVAKRFDELPQYDGITTKVQHLSRFDKEPGLVDRHNIFFRMCENALYVRRERLGDLLFDEQLGVGAGTIWGADEGPDFLLRAMDHGLRFYYVPDLEMHHPNPMQNFDKKTMQRAYSYACGRGYFFRRHRYPLHRCGWFMFRSLVGSCLMFATGRFGRGRFYYNSFAGQLRGYFSSGPQPSRPIARAASTVVSQASA